MGQESFWTVLITAITVLGSASAWRFYEKRAEKKKPQEKEQQEKEQQEGLG